MSTKTLLSNAGKPKEKSVQNVQVDPEIKRVKKTVTLDPMTVKRLNMLKAQALIRDDEQTDFGRLIDEAIKLLMENKNLTIE